MPVWDFTAQEASRKGNWATPKLVHVSHSSTILKDGGTGRLKAVSRFSLRRPSLVYLL